MSRRQWSRGRGRASVTRLLQRPQGADRDDRRRDDRRVRSGLAVDGVEHPTGDGQRTSEGVAVADRSEAGGRLGGMSLDGDAPAPPRGYLPARDDTDTAEPPPPPPRA